MIRFPAGSWFSPACAGNAAGSAWRFSGQPVQPRVCGERPNSAPVTLCHHGSAPRVRGTLRNPHADSAELRFSPACAGNAASPAAGAGTRPVQPRVCGERRDRARAEVFQRGSAPRVRGTRYRRHVFRSVGRFSPACAGNASFVRSVFEKVAVQPRVCGERHTPKRCFAEVGGSAPRVRGTLHRPRHSRLVGRFSPACAGNALALRSSTIAAAVQPRVCGERYTATSIKKRIDGSAPRVRGTPAGGASRTARSRFSPACAGNASLRTSTGTR